MVLSEPPSQCNKRIASALIFHIRVLKNADCLLGNSETGHFLVWREASELSNSTTETMEENMPWQLASWAKIRGSFILNKSTFVTPSALYRVLSDGQTELSRKKESSGQCEREWIKKWGRGPWTNAKPSIARSSPHTHIEQVSLSEKSLITYHVLIQFTWAPRLIIKTHLNPKRRWARSYKTSLQAHVKPCFTQKSLTEWVLFIFAIPRSPSSCLTRGNSAAHGTRHAVSSTVAIAFWHCES